MAARDHSKTAYVILGMLALGKRTGYEIKALVDVSTRFFWAASYGQIYPELKRLEEAGLIRGEEDPSHGRRPSRAARLAHVRSAARPRAAPRGRAQALLLGHPRAEGAARADPPAQGGARGDPRPPSGDRAGRAGSGRGEGVALHAPHARLGNRLPGRHDRLVRPGGPRAGRAGPRGGLACSPALT